MSTEKVFDIFMGRLGGWHTTRVSQNAGSDILAQWLAKGYRVECEHRIGVRLYEVYLVK